MKKILFINLLLLLSVSISALEPFNLTLSKVDEHCTGTGQITATVTDATVGAVFTFRLYDVNNLGTPVNTVSGINATATTLSHTFTSLQMGNYKVVALQEQGTESNLQSAFIEVSHNVVPIEFTIKQERTDCNPAKIIVNVTEGSPHLYTILDLNNQIVMGPQTSNEFTFGAPLQDGQTYRLKVTDDCNDEYVKEFKVNNFEVNLSASLLKRTKYSCNNVKFTSRINNSPYRLPTYIFPIKVEITLKAHSNYSSTSPIVSTETKTSYIYKNIPYLVAYTVFNLPFFTTENHLLSVSGSMTDACGNILTSQNYTRRTGGLNFFLSSQKVSSNSCSKDNRLIWILRKNENYPISTLALYNSNIKMLEYPSGYNPMADGFDQNGEKTQDIGSDNYYKLINTKGHYGTYKMRFTYCNGEVSERTFNLTKPTPPTYNFYLNEDYYNLVYNCNYTRKKIMLKANSNPPSWVSILNAKIIEAPQEFINEFGLPYTITSPYLKASIIDFRKLGFPGLPAGQYKIEVKEANNCDTQVVVKPFSIANLPQIEYEKFTIIPHSTCQTARLNVELKMTGNRINRGYLIEKYYPDVNKWGSYTQNSPSNYNYTTQYIYPHFLVRNGSNSVITKTVDIPYPSVPTRYRVLVQWKTVEESGDKNDRYCYKILKEFELDPAEIKLKNYFILQCNGDRYLTVSADGLDPLKYQIIKENGVPTSAYPETTTPLFGPLNAGYYTLKVKDKCGNSRDFEISTTQIRKPQIVAENLCLGDNGRLYIPHLSNFTIKWYKNGSFTGVVGNEYPFNPLQDSDRAIYTATITHPTLNSTCLNQPLQYDLSDLDKEVEAGTGTTAHFLVQNQNNLIDLFDHLTPPYDDNGIWEDVDGTGNMFGQYLQLKGLTTGTYRFKHKVQGICEDKDSTIVTIVIGNNYWHGGTAGSENNWNTATNWTAHHIPLSTEDVEFATASNNNGNPASHDLHVPGDVNNPTIIRNLINESNKVLVVPADKLILINGAVIGSSTIEDVNKILVKTEPNKPNGTIIFKGQPCSNPIYGSVQMHAKGKQILPVQTWIDNISGSPTFGQEFKTSYEWQHFGVPVESVRADDTFYKAYLREYDETYNNDTAYYHKWHDLHNSSILQAFKGYEITQETPRTYQISGKLQICNKQVTMTRKASIVQGSTDPNNEHYGLGQNIFGNSYTASIDVSKMDFPPQIEQTVYLYNTGRFYDWTNSAVNNGNALVAGQYTAIPKNSPVVYDGRIPSMNGFLLRFKDTETIYNNPDVPVTLNYNSLAVPNTKQQTAPKQELSYLDITLNSKSTIDKLCFVDKKGTTEGFDNGWDGRKFFGTPTAFIFTETKDGHMQVNTSETLNNKIITFYANQDDDYQLTLVKNNLNKYKYLTLLDLKEKKLIRLEKDTMVYRFTASKSDVLKKRFRLVNSKNITEEMFSISYLTGSYDTKKITVTNTTRFKNGLIRIFDVSGRLMFSDRVNTGYNSYPVNLTNGVYLVHLVAGTEEYNFKIMVNE